MNDIDILKSFFKGNELKEALKKYENNVPAAYIIGEWEFCGDRYKLNESCLIPRCDTERVVEKLLENLKENSTFADLCTGSGCIAISTLKRKPKTKCIAVDISENALSAAKENALINGVSEQIKFLCADIFSNPLNDMKFDIIVSNPPYISSEDMQKLDDYVKKEPSIALDGGYDGMDFYKHIIENCKNNLNEDGMFIFEIGYDQEEKIKILAKEHGFECIVTKDYSGNPRVALLK